MPIDYSRYPPNWKKEIRPAILERANNCCEFCGNKNGSIVIVGQKKVKGRTRSKHYPSREAAEQDGCCETWYSKYNSKRELVPYARGIYETKVVLTIAHLDHDEDNWEVKPERLAALCQLCHLQYDAKEKYRRLLEKSTQKLK
jgi:hypothetical protein